MYARSKTHTEQLAWSLAAEHGLLLELAGRVRGGEPSLTRDDLTEFTVRERCDISKARRELRFLPKTPARAVSDALSWLGSTCAGKFAGLRQASRA